MLLISENVTKRDKNIVQVAVSSHNAFSLYFTMTFVLKYFEGDNMEILKCFNINDMKLFFKYLPEYLCQIRINFGCFVMRTNQKCI